MITFRTGNLLADDAIALVNAVNCVGVMGKGIALQFKRAYPDMFRLYVYACREGKVRPGEVFACSSGSRWLVNFPTKRHWRDSTCMQDIEEGMVSLERFVRKRSISSIAIPALGCGNGRMAWERVLPVIEAAFYSLPAVDVRLYPAR